jgi:hypothetical protein
MVDVPFQPAVSSCNKMRSRRFYSITSARASSVGGIVSPIWDCDGVLIDSEFLACRVSAE